MTASEQDPPAPSEGEAAVDAGHPDTGGRPVVLLSHRGPISFERDDHGRSLTRGGGGLVTALLGLSGQLDEAVWVCASTSTEDARVMRESEGELLTVALEPEPHLLNGVTERCRHGDAEHGQTLTMRKVATDPQAHMDFYSVIANPLLWFIQHGLYGRGRDPDLTWRDRDAFEDGYVVVNRVFADAVIDEVRSFGGRAVVMLHDYHFYLVGQQVRDACPDALLSHFVHIPWPGPDDWRILPPDMRERILRGLLGNDVVAFHTKRFARNFLLCAQELLELPVDLRRMSVWVEGREVLARYYPISVEIEQLERLAAAEAVQEHARLLRSVYTGGDHQLILRVDRTDPSKNIVRGFRAYDTLLADHPELFGRVTFLAMLQPSRQDVPEYADYLAAIGAVAAEVNARHGGEGWQPIDLRIMNDLEFAVAAYTVCDVLLVNAVNDGMNLVAKETVVVNERDGVLALSENTGAHQELGDHAVTVYPFDIQQQADALYEALTTPREERHRWLVAAKDAVRSNHLGHWIAAQLEDLLHLRYAGNHPTR